MADEARSGAAAQRLRSAVELLSLPGTEALARRGLARPDALAVEFDEAYTVYVAALATLPSDAQLEGLQALDGQLQAMSDPELRDKWTAAAMKTDSDWQVVRERARAVMAAFAW